MNNYNSYIMQPSLAEKTSQRLLAELRSGRYAVDQPLPAVRDWARKFRVSAFTVHRALNDLKKRGIVESTEGSYTFLRAIPTEQQLAARPAGPVRISMWANDRKDFWKLRAAIVRQRFQSQFHQRHPHVEFDVQQVERRASEVEMMLVQSVVSGPEPTFAGTNQTCVPFLAEHGALAAIDETDGYVSQIKPRYREAFRVNGRLLAVPTGATHTMLLYHKGLFQKAGLERPPRDWQELADCAQRISAVDGGRPSLHVAGPGSAVLWLMHLVCQALPARDGDRVSAFTWTSAAARAAIQHFVELHSTRRVLSLHERELATLIPRCLAGEFAMLVGEWGSVAQIALMKQTDRFGIAPLPVGPNGRTISLMNCGGWFVNAHGSPEQQAAATEYAVAWEQWLHRGEGGNLMRRLGGAPRLVSVLEDPAADQFVAKELPADWQATVDQLEATALWEPVEADWKKLALGRALEELLGDDEPLSAERVMHAFDLREHEAGFGELIPPLVG